MKNDSKCNILDGSALQLLTVADLKVQESGTEASNFFCIFSSDEYDWIQISFSYENAID